MRRKFIVIQVFLAIVISLLCGFVLFGCGGTPKAPEVKDLQITAADGNSFGKAGALHKVTYTATEGSEISTSVQLGEDMAKVTDYVCLNDEYIFYTAGTYTITVYASKKGMLGQESTTVTVLAGEASVSDVKISAAAGETAGKVGALHVVTYAADAECKIDVEIKKGGEVASDVAFDAIYNTLIFRSAGHYTVKVTATLNGESDSAEAEIDIAVTNAPTVNLSFDKSSVPEGEEVILNHTVLYAVGDSCKEESVSVLYRAGNAGAFNKAAENTYTLIGDRFTPDVTGDWRIVYKAESNGGASKEANVTIKCTPAEISLSLKTAGRQRIQTGTPTDIGYLVSGEAERFNVAIDTHDKSGVTAVKGEGNSVRVTAEDMDCFTVTLTFTHKQVNTFKKTFDIDIYAVDNIAYAPVIVGDPFDGMPAEVLTSMGHILRFEAASCVGDKRELTYKDVEYEVIEHNVTASSGGTDVELLYAAEDENYPYVIVTNFDNNVATGNFTLKMTLTDPYTGYTAIATRKFTVTPTTNNNGDAATRIKSFIEKYPDYFHIGNMNFGNISSDCRQNMVLTRTGTIMQRSNPSWPLKDANGSNNSDFAKMEFASAASDCRLEFKFNLLAANPGSDEAWLGIGMRTVNDNGWVGFFDLHVVDGALDVTTGLQGVTAEYVSDAERPLALNNTVLYVRIDRRVNGNLAEYTVYVKTEEGAAYEQFCRCTAAVSSSAGNAGAPVKQYQFTHRNAGGCYAVEDVTLTVFGS